MPMKILVLHGPNLNLLGERAGDEKGRTLDELNRQIREKALSLGQEVKILQSNHEGVLVDAIHAERRWADGILINPGALAPTSYVLRDALAAVGKPALEIHLTDIRRRESWRRKSVLKDVCAGHVVGKGFDSYLIGLERLSGGKPEGGKKSGRAERAPRAAKTLGRKAAEESAAEGSASERAGGRLSPVEKTLGPAGARTSGKAPAEAPGKTLGRQGKEAAVGALTRARVRQMIADRLSGKLTSAGLATWARTQWLEVQRGAPAESGQRELLEDALQMLVVSARPDAYLSDEQLIELMTQLEG